MIVGVITPVSPQVRLRRATVHDAQALVQLRSLMFSSMGSNVGARTRRGASPQPTGSASSSTGRSSLLASSSNTPTRVSSLQHSAAAMCALPALTM